MTDLKNIVQIRKLLVTRTLMLTIQHTVADDLVIDTTYNIVNPLFDSGNVIMNSDLYDPDKIQYIIKDLDTLFFWLSVGALLTSLYYANHDYIIHNEGGDDKNRLDRLKKFIPYNEIRNCTSFVITLFVFLFTKNVLPAT